MPWARQVQTDAHNEGVGSRDQPAAGAPTDQPTTLEMTPVALTAPPSLTDPASQFQSPASDQVRIVQFRVRRTLLLSLAYG